MEFTRRHRNILQFVISDRYRSSALIVHLPGLRPPPRHWTLFVDPKPLPEFRSADARPRRRRAILSLLLSLLYFSTTVVSVERQTRIRTTVIIVVVIVTGGRGLTSKTILFIITRWGTRVINGTGVHLLPPCITNYQCCCRRRVRLLSHNR